MQMPAKRSKLKATLLHSTATASAFSAILAPQFLPGLTTTAANVLSGSFLACLTSIHLLHRSIFQSLAWSAARLNKDIAALHDHAIVSTTGADGNFDHVNHNFLAVTGYEMEQLIGRKPHSFYHPDDQKRYRDILRYLDRGEAWTGELRLIGNDGGTVWTQSTILPRMNRFGKRTGTISVRTDITDHRAMVGMRDMVASLHKLLDPILMICPASLQVVYANLAALRLFGWDGTGYEGRRLDQIAFAGDHENLTTALASMTTASTEQLSFEIDYDNTPFRADVQMIVPDAGDPRLFMVMRNQMADRELGRAKEEFISTVSHELRTPLTSIKGALGLILSGATGAISPKTKDLLSIAHRNADRLVLIVNDILDLEKLAAGRHDYDLRAQDLNQSLRDAADANQAFADRFGVKIDIVPCGEPAVAIYDSHRIHQVLTNLMSNACKFSQPGGTVNVSIETTDNVHAISVTDSGAGIPAEALETIFERFSKAGRANSNKSGSTGLGLSIVKAIVESHGGDVVVTSTEGVGTRVTFRLKRHLAAATSSETYAAAV